MIITFAIPKFNSVNESSNILALKSEFALVQSALVKAKSRNVLLQNQNDIDSLDDAKINTKSEELFKNILDKPILSTTVNEKKYGQWAKLSNKKYIFFTQSKTFEFLFDNSEFRCVSNEILCKEIE